MVGAENDKDICTKLKKRLEEDVELNVSSVTNVESNYFYLYLKENIEENGVWQVIIGKQYAASVTFDAKFMIYFYFEDASKYFLVFRS